MVKGGDFQSISNQFPMNFEWILNGFPLVFRSPRFFFGALPHAFCLGESALVGGAGEAWLRSGEHRMPKLRETKYIYIYIII